MAAIHFQHRAAAGCSARLLDFIREEAVRHRLFFGIGHFVGDEAARSASWIAYPGSIGASRRTSPVLSAASDWTTSTESPVSADNSSGVGSRRIFSGAGSHSP